jgi:acetyl esterase/lipase
VRKNMIDRIDPEIAGPFKAQENVGGGPLDLHNIPAARAASERMMTAMRKRQPVITGVTSADKLAPGPNGAPDVPVRIYQPKNRTDMLPALLWIHGGGYIFGNIENEDLMARQLTLAAGCVVAAVEYRLAPECPFPGPVEDCYAALKWVAAHARELGVDPARIAIGGASAGGGLAAGLALLARDRKEVNVIFQLLIYPMLDDCNTAPASASLPDTLLWRREDNLIGWKSYLGCKPGGKGVSPYASAFRATDLTSLPPTYITVGELDLFRNENVLYAQRLIEAGVPTDLHVYAGAFHAFDAIAPGAGVSKRFTADYQQALEHALHG